MNMQIFNSTATKLTTVFLVLCFLVSQANAQSTIENVTLNSGENGAVKINFEFSGQVTEPKVFSTNLPPRLALDFENTRNNSDMDSQTIGIGQARGLRIVSAGNKTRAVIDLTGPAEHSITTLNNTVTVTVLPGQRYVQQGGQQVTTINDIDFRRGEEGQAVVQIGLSDPNAIINISENMDKVVIEVANANLDESLDLKMDVIDFATPVNYVDARQRGGDVKIEVEAKGAFEKMAYQTGNRYTVEIAEQKVEAESKSRLLDDEIEYDGHLVSFNFQDIPVRSLLQLIADASQLNIVVADSVQGNVTLRLNNVPWDQALDIVLRSKQLDQRRRGDVIWVAPAAEIAELEQKKLEAHSKKQELEPLDNIFIQVNYAKAEDLASLISGEGGGQGGGGGTNKLLSDRGSVAFDERTNTLLVTDVPDRLRVIQNLVETLDRSVQQVQIESRIVVASEKFGDELGVRFGVTGSHEDRYGNIISTGGSAAALDRMNNAALTNRYNSPSGSGLPTVIPDDERSSPIAGPPIGERLNVNLPTAATNAGRWAMSILAADYLLDLELSALESEDRGEVISSPRVITANQTQAVIQQGVQIPYEEATSSGATSIQFKDATLSLEVTPLITPDDRVDLTLSVKQDAIGQEVSTALGGSVPSIDTRSVQTRVLVSNGQTVVLGGIYEQVRRTTRSKVPVLGDIPGLGALFRNKAVQDDKAELLIFVTPTIIKESL